MKLEPGRRDQKSAVRAQAAAVQAGRRLRQRLHHQRLRQPVAQQRIADRGDQMRVYIPYGEEWYGYLMRRMAEKPGNLMFFLRGVATKG